MKHNSRSTITHKAYLLLLFIVVLLRPAYAKMTPWQEFEGAKIRLLSSDGFDNYNKTIFLGVEIILDQGWKTYWHTPGSAGIAPEIHIEPAYLFEKAELLFPVPTLFQEAGISAIGYDRSVILPLKIIKKERKEKLIIKVSIDLGLCKDICIPASYEGKITLDMKDKRDGVSANKIHRARLAIPEQKSAISAHHIELVRTPSKSILAYIDDRVQDVFLHNQKDASSPIFTPVKHEKKFIKKQNKKTLGFKLKPIKQELTEKNHLYLTIGFKDGQKAKQGYVEIQSLEEIKK